LLNIIKIDKMGCTSFRRGLVILSVVLGIVGIVSLSLGATLYMDAKNVKNFPGFSERECTLDKVQVTTLPSNCGYIVTWRDKTSGMSVISDPFSATESKAIAVSRMIDYPLFVKTPCMCTSSSLTYPNISGVNDQCEVWETCILNTKLGNHIKTDGEHFYKLGLVSLSFGLICLAVCILVGILNCCCGGKMETCCGGNGERYPYQHINV
jgi:hypothetical protein